MIAPSPVISDARASSPSVDVPVEASVLCPVVVSVGVVCALKVKIDVAVSPSGVVAVTWIFPVWVGVFFGIVTRMDASGVISACHPVGIVVVSMV